MEQRGINKRGGRWGDAQSRAEWLQMKWKMIFIWQLVCVVWREAPLHKGNHEYLELILNSCYSFYPIKDCAGPAMENVKVIHMSLTQSTLGGITLYTFINDKEKMSQSPFVNRYLFRSYWGRQVKNMNICFLGGWKYVHACVYSSLPEVLKVCM